MTQSIQFLSSVEHIMNCYGPVASTDDSVANAKAMIEANDGNPVPVVERDGTFVGVLSSESLRMDGPSPVGKMTTRARMTVAPHESAFSVVSRMLTRRIDWAPVINQGKVVGTISRACVMSAFGETRNV